MELRHCVTVARALTLQLENALANQDSALLDDMDECAGLLERRAQALADFESAHRNAEPAEREACRSEISALRADDARLRGRSGEILEKLAEEFKLQMGLSVSGPGTRDVEDFQACLDRKA